MAEKIVQEELNLDTKVTVRNIAGWNVGFARKADGYGDITIAPNGTVRLSRNEIIAQIQNGNKLFCGIDGVGSHATLYVDDEATRKEVNFESDDKKQMVFFTLNLKDLFSIKSQPKFETEFENAVRTRAEKFAVIEAMKKERVNDYAKIRFAEQYTGYKYQ